MIKLTVTDGGKAQSEFHNETNDCGVRALAIGANISYGDAHDMLQERGRRNRKGTKLPWLVSALESLSSVGVKFERPDRYKGATLTTFLNNNKTGRFILITNRHGLAVIDGIVHDTGIISGPRCRLRNIFKIELPVVQLPAPTAITQDQVNSLWDRLNKLEGKV